MRNLSSAERRRLRGEAHHLKPVVQVGKDGVTGSVVAEVDRSLESHELIKVKLAGDRDERDDQARALAKGADAALIGTIGGVAILYREQLDGDDRTRS